MNITSEISDEILVHEKWKCDFFNDIENGIIREDIGKAEECEMGKWLDDIAVCKQGNHYRVVKELHNEFHKEVGEVVVDINNYDPFKYIRKSTRMILAMTEWYYSEIEKEKKIGIISRIKKSINKFWCPITNDICKCSHKRREV